MEQQRYTLKDINFVAEENYTDINSKIVGFQIDNNMVLSMDIADRLSGIINKMLADYYADTCKRLEPSDFHVTMSIEMNTSTNKVIINADHMAALPERKYIGVLATGYNVVDTAAAKERGIVVTNIPSYSTASVAQMVFSHILNITQQVQHHSEEVHKGRWTNNKDFCFWDTPLMELRDKKIGLVGLGNTGYTLSLIHI